MVYNMKNKKHTTEYELCYPILEETKSSFMSKIILLEKDHNSILELRIDYLLNNNISINEIILMINDIQKDLTKKKLIVTIRSEREGGKLKINDEEYYQYIENLYYNVHVDYIDIEYNFYKNNIVKYESLFENRLKKIILSSHIFGKTLSKKEYESLFSNMSKANIDIVKCAVMVKTKKELFDFMTIARKSSIYIKNDNKFTIFIAMGEIGGISRIWPEFTNTKIVFLTAYSEKMSKIGQFSYENFVKYRNMLEKIIKNC